MKRQVLAFKSLKKSERKSHKAGLTLLSLMIHPISTQLQKLQGQIIDAETLAITQKDAELAFLANMFNPKTARGIWQDALAEIYFIKRKEAVNSR